MKWICWPSMSVRKCGQRLNRVFLRAPVERRAPVVAEVLQVREVGAVVPAASRESGRASACGRAGRGGRRAPPREPRRGTVGCRRPCARTYPPTRPGAPPCAASIATRLRYDEYQTIAATIATGAADERSTRSATRSTTSSRCRRARTPSRGTATRRSRPRMPSDEREDREHHEADEDEQLRPADGHASSLHAWPSTRSHRSASTARSRSSPARAPGSARASHGCSTPPARASCSRRGAPNGSKRSPVELRDAHVVPCDLAEDGAPAALVAATLAHYGRVDVLVNNAGTSEPTPALDETTDHFAATLRVNLVAPFELARECARAMIESGDGGTIVNVASIWGLVGVGQIPEAGYAASKGGLVNLTRELAAQWARRGVRVNCLAPGWFRTRDDRRPDVRRRERGTLDAPAHADGPRRRRARARRRAALPRERREQLRDRPGRSASTAAGPRSEEKAPSV